MKFSPTNWDVASESSFATLVPEVEATLTSLALKGTFERMAKRRHQTPSPFRDGGYWWIRPWIDVFVEGKLQRKQKRVKLAPETLNQREVLKIRNEYLRPINQSLESIGSATNFTNYVTTPTSRWCYP